MHQARAVSDIHVLEHSFVAAKMSGLRDKTTATVHFVVRCGR
jgi:uracil phosphoribosyltransferase